MAPEVLLDASTYSPSADVYSFGVVLWELLALDLPPRYCASLRLLSGRPSTHRPDELASAVREVCEKAARPALSDHRRADPFAPLIQRCLATEPSRRPLFHALTPLLEALLSPSSYYDQRTQPKPEDPGYDMPLTAEEEKK